jgi:hypothetical protein
MHSLRHYRIRVRRSRRLPYRLARHVLRTIPLLLLILVLIFLHLYVISRR